MAHFKKMHHFKKTAPFPKNFKNCPKGSHPLKNTGILWKTFTKWWPLKGKTSHGKMVPFLGFGSLFGPYFIKSWGHWFNPRHASKFNSVSIHDLNVVKASNFTVHGAASGSINVSEVESLGIIVIPENSLFSGNAKGGENGISRVWLFLLWTSSNKHFSVLNVDLSLLENMTPTFVPQSDCCHSRFSKVFQVSKTFT